MDLNTDSNFLQEFYKQIVDGVIIINNDYKIIHCNKMIQNTFEYTEDELVGCDLSILLPENVKKKHNSYIKDFADSNLQNKNMGDRNIDLFGLSKSKVQIPIDITISKIEVQNKTCFLAIVRDISEKAQLLNESIIFQKRYRDFFQRSQNAIILVKDGKFIDVNNSAIKIFERKSKEEFLNLNFEDLLPEFQFDGKSSLEAVQEKIFEATKSGKIEFNFGLKTSTGKNLTAKISLAKINLGGEELLEGILEDVSESIKEKNKLIEDKNQSEQIATEFEKANTSLLSITNILSSYLESGASENVINKLLDNILKISNSKFGCISKVEYRNGKPFIIPIGIPTHSFDEKSKLACKKLKKDGIKFSNLSSIFKKVITSKKHFISNSSTEDCYLFDPPLFNKKSKNTCAIPLIKNKQLIGLIGLADCPDGYTNKIIDDLILFILTCTQILNDAKTRENQLILKEEAINIAKELRQFIETANAPIFGIDKNGKVNEWNQTAEKITKFSKDEVMGKDLVETYITEDYRESVKNVLDDALKGKETANYEFPLFTKDGRRVMVLLNSTTRRDSEGNIVGVLGVGQDISELDKYRTETEAIAKELRHFVETANAPIFGIDNQGRVNEWNQTAEKITKFSKEEVFGKDLVETYITEDYRESVKKVLDDALNGKETANYEFPIFTKDNRRVMVLLNSNTRRDSDGNIVGVLGVGQDITELDEYKETLESKVKIRTQELEESLEREKELGILKTNFVSMASHEFRTPLAAINATTDVVQRYRDRLREEDIDKRLVKIKKEVNDMTTMLEDILIIGKSDSQKLKFKPIEFNLTEKIINIISEYQLSQAEQRIINFHKPDEEIIVNADPKWIKHIVINLLSNAIKYSDADKPVDVNVKKENNNVVFSFKDYGIGIPKEDIKNLFEPFHRGKNVGNISGTGLGLAVLHKAAELHGGTIDVQSEVGVGSKFTISLPQ